MESFLQDVRYSWRLLRRAPGFTAVAVLTLALGIGANTAIFSIVNSVILRPLGYRAPEQLMYLTTQFPGLGFAEFWVSPPEYMELREINQSFSAVGAFTTGEVNLTAGDRPLRARSAGVDEHLFRALGVQAAQGRLFGDGETNISSPPPTSGQPLPPNPPPATAILSHELWQSAFGGRPMIGEGVEVNGRRLEVLGIMPRGADVMDNRTEIWLPLGLNPANRQNRTNHFLYVVGRLKDGTSPQAANAELEGLMKNWGERVGVTSHAFQRPDHFLQMEPLQDQMLGGATRAIWVLQAAVGLVLLIACANLANLLLARAERRHREFALRTALGAGRWQLLRQFMTEGVLLSVAGGALGVLLATAGVRVLVHAYPTSLPRTSEVAVDSLALLFTLGVAMATGALFGLAPIMHTRAKGLAAALKDGSAKGATAGARNHIRRGLVVVEVALAVMLVIGAALLGRTVSNLTKVDAGFDRSRLVTFSITLPPPSYPRPALRGQLYQQLLEKLRAVPGVQGATAMSGLPPDRPLNARDTDMDNYTASKEDPYENVDYYQNVMSNYFETMGIPIVQGRGFEPADAASGGRVAVVNEKLVNRFWKGLNPIGQRLRPGSSNSDDPWFTVVGVAKDVKQGGVNREAGTEVYAFVNQLAALPPPFTSAPATMNVVLRTTLTPAALAQSVGQVVREADRSVPVVRLREMDDVFDETIQRPRLLAQLVGAFAGLALLLAAIGTYGVLSYSVAERRREIGIRLALGAARAQVLTQVMKQGLLLTTIGVFIGLAGAFGLNRLLTTLLFGVVPGDTATTIGVIATMTMVAAAACWLPAWRASRLDPNVVLRDE
jgi:putative ABC transport system permease protein